MEQIGCLCINEYVIFMSNDTAIDLYPIRCSCGNSYFFIDSENMELICTKCDRRIPIDKLNVDKDFIEICVKDVCVTLLPINHQIANLMNELAYYASPSYPSNSSTSINTSSREKEVRIPIASLIIISLYLFFFILVMLNTILHVFPFSLISVVFMVIVVLSFFLSLFL